MFTGSHLNTERVWRICKNALCLKSTSLTEKCYSNLSFPSRSVCGVLFVFVEVCGK